uniref:Putative perakine reductase n=1 Tax=Davidia involucrata TaxID=16924 RepID=A0A5B7C7V1_DAVIN
MEDKPQIQISGVKLGTQGLECIHPRFTGENIEKNKLLYARLANLAAKHNCTTPQLALAWLLHQGDDVIPNPGTTKIKNLDNNIGSLAVKAYARGFERNF